MTTGPDPSLLAHVLPQLLKKQRERSGMSGAALARRIKTSQSTISRIENGKQLPTPEQVRQIVEALPVEDDVVDLLVGMAAAAGSQSWSATPGITQQLAGVLELEPYARRITEWSPLLVPGLLQTRDTAYAMLETQPLTPAEIRNRWYARQSRQDGMAEREPVLEYVAFIGEPEISNAFAGPDTLLGQLRNLVTQAQRPSVTIRLVPLGGERWHLGREGAFHLYEFAPPIPAAVHHELPSLGMFLFDLPENAAAVQNIRHTIEQLDDRAFSPDKSLDLIEAEIKELERDSSGG